MLSSKLGRRIAGGAAAVAVACALSACAIEPETIHPYNPSQGINATQDTMKLRNIVLVAGPSSAYLSGGLNSSVDDSLTGATGQAINADGSDGNALGIQGSTVQIPAAELVQLSQSGLAVTGSPKPGSTARLTLQFAKAGTVTMTVPVLDAKHPDYATVTPKAPTSSASASATPSASASASVSANASAPATPAAPSASASR